VATRQTRTDFDLWEPRQDRGEVRARKSPTCQNVVVAARRAEEVDKVIISERTLRGLGPGDPDWLCYRGLADIRVLLHARRSSGTQTFSLIDQRKELTDFCERWGIDVVGTCEETASGRTLDRPEFARFVDHAGREGLPILDVNLTRLVRGRKGRKIHDVHPEDMRALQDSPVRFALIQSPEATPADVRSVETARGMASATSRGRHVGRPKQDKSERDARIARLRAEGLTLREIGKQLGTSHTSVRRALERVGLER